MRDRLRHRQGCGVLRAPQGQGVDRCRLLLTALDRHHLRAHRKGSRRQDTAERGEVTKGSIVFDGTEVQSLSPNEVVRRGCIQVMEGRRCFAHLTVEENLLTGAFTRRDGKAAVAVDLERVYAYFPRLKERRGSTAGYTSGGEQ